MKIYTGTVKSWPSLPFLSQKFHLSWTLYLSLLLFPFPSFVITKVDTGYSKNVSDYRDHVIIGSDSAISDYARNANIIK